MIRSLSISSHKFDLNHTSYLLYSLLISLCLPVTHHHINFGAPTFKEGVRRLMNQHYREESSREDTKKSKEK